MIVNAVTFRPNDSSAPARTPMLLLLVCSDGPTTPSAHLYVAPTAVILFLNVMCSETAAPSAHLNAVFSAVVPALCFLCSKTAAQNDSFHSH